MGHHCTGAIGLFVVSWRAHVALGIVGIIAIPGGHRRTRHTNFEDVGSAHQGHTGHIAAIAPSIDAGAPAVYIGTLGHEAYTIHLVVNLDVAQGAGYRTLEGQTTIGTAAV